MSKSHELSNFIWSIADLIRRVNEQANETAGDRCTPRKVIQRMVNLLFMHDDNLLTKPDTVRTLRGPTCGTGDMLSEARTPPRPLAEIDADLKKAEAEILRLLSEVTTEASSQ